MPMEKTRATRNVKNLKEERRRYVEREKVKIKEFVETTLRPLLAEIPPEDYPLIMAEWDVLTNRAINRNRRIGPATVIPWKPRA
jgi:hypothetical protein